MQLLRWLSWTGYRLDTGASSHRGAGQSVLADPQIGLSSQPKNFASWLQDPQTQLSVSTAPIPKCGSDDLILKNHVVAVNPVDWKIQSTGGVGFDLEYPLILGEDVAGEVLQVGSNLKDRFQVGDRVMAHTMGLGLGSAYGGFQLYPILTAATTSKIPDGMSFRDAAVLPLSISTAAAGLFLNASLGLAYPPTGHKARETQLPLDGPTLLVWGCSSSVGSSVIQLARAAGYQVITTASPSNHKYCETLGASHVLDYHDADVADHLIALLKGKKIVGAYDAIGSDVTVRQTASILHALGGGKIASVGLAPDVFSDVIVSSISSGAIVTDEPEVADEIWGKYVPWALESGELIPSPKALVVGKGLEDVQKGLDRQKEGVSARKVEVLLA
ncbi:Zinc-binding alcohol dehydrogenase domain-containing cipB [Hyphodiscus hymeniophilus]|uniref:Zinc-binding alcohol dehydrogenase domain-containing cipB n=1 Tax=Hyphodiscus hymeniophilus TaxID=353542 RepID=A0A9P6VRS5_9HELO|nr:Zinc-binding alcohol dehydrogenase domain-containing cipB [Hyphodiscus hymeniophilus]